jgi:hypothetical protein
LTNRVIDFVKIDTEGAEWDVIADVMSRQPGLLCDHVKQLAVETHSWLNNHTYNYAVIRKLDACFRLFRRDQRFYIELEKTEWQRKDGFYLNLKMFHDEIDLARVLFIYGELYFVNVNFIV